MVRSVPGTAIPEEMVFLLDYRVPSGWTRKAVEAGHLLRVDYHPPYVQMYRHSMDRLI